MMQTRGELRRRAITLDATTSPAVCLALVGIVLGALAGAVAANPALARPMTPEDVARLQAVEATAVAPEGDAVAYRVRVPRIPFEDPDGKPWSELWVAEGSDAPRPFVTGEVNVAAVTWTPDGSGISFLAERSEQEADGDGDHGSSLHVIPRDGGEARRVLEHPGGLDAYSWSPDGDRVVFLAENEKPEELEELEEAGFDASVVEEDWRFRQVWIARPGSEEPPRPLSLQGHAHAIRWCPGGDRLAVTLAPDPSVDASYMFTRIKVVDPASGTILTSIDNPGKLGAMSWSPDCTHLAFISGADIHDPAAGRLMVASAEDGSFRDIVPGYEGHVVEAHWLDAETLIFLGDEGLASALYSIDRDGSERSMLLEPGETVWSEIDVSSSGDPRHLSLVGESPRHPAELFTTRLEGGSVGAPERRTDSNPALSEIDLAPQEAVTYRARDGVEIQGVLVRPLEREGADRVPLILTVHGGPESHFRNGWITSYSRPGQVAAGRGFAVFYPNYRGSTGRGVDFSLLSQGEPAGAEFDDLVDGVDHLIEQGLVDAERVGITGGSYGGYASAWGATYYSERFAASVMFVGISDKLSKLGTSDIPEELYLVHERKRPWDDWQHFLEASPIYYVEKARTPILILGGEDDTRVDPSQSLELYRHLKTLEQAPVRLVQYPGEGHGNRRAASRYDYHLRMLRWFDHYLMGSGGEPPSWRLDYPLRAMADDEKDDREDGDDQGEG